MQDSHPLYQPGNRRRLRQIGIILALLTLAAELFVPLHGYFGFAEVFGFNAISGLIGTVALIVLALILGVILRRRDDYYDAG